MNSDDLLPIDIPQIIYSPTSKTSTIGQCDACSSIVFERNVKLSNNLAITTLQITPSLYRQKISADYIVIKPLFVDKIVVVNHSARMILEHFYEPRHMIDIPQQWLRNWGGKTVRSTLAQLIVLGLLMPVEQPVPSFEMGNTLLAAWLHITDRCNLRCQYCYLPHMKQDMSWETGQRVVDLVLESAVKHGYPQVKLKYSGGEALLRFPFVIQLHKYAMQQAEVKGLLLDAVLLSNGTLLTAEIAQTMKALGLRLMISLDGLGVAHDAQRPFASGKGSFQDVERGINIALEHGLIPDISITVSGKNAHGLPDVVGWVLERDLPFSLNFYRENDLSASHADLQLEEEIIISGMLAAYKVIEENVPRRSLLASLVDRGNLSAPHEHTCGVGNNYMVFDYKGRVSKCQMQMEHAVTTIDADDPLELIRTDTIGIQNISVEEKEGCRDCEWKYWCAGGCPLTTYRATGRYDVKSPNCNIYKAIYPQAMRLEGLRLLKYHLHDNQIETVPALEFEQVGV